MTKKPNEFLGFGSFAYAHLHGNLAKRKKQWNEQRKQTNESRVETKM